VSGPARRARGLTQNVFAIVRRRSDDRKTRARVRIAHGETRVLAEGDPARERLMAIASDLVSEYGKGTRGSG
jgi:hypothetical protein